MWKVLRKWLKRSNNSNRINREWMIWIGDGIAANAKQQIGRSAFIEGRSGKVVDATALMILIEWEE